MFVLQMLLFAQLSFAATEVPVQMEVDRAFDLILRTQVGKAICRDILGSDPQALKLHLGISEDKSLELARNCGGSEPSEWIYPTSPSDIRKITINAAVPRKYKLVQSDSTFPIESWTDSFTNTTTILSKNRNIPFARMVQILAHETAVYFDSKSNPLHPRAQEIQHLRGLNLKEPGQMDPLVAVSNPLQAHTLTYLRALQVEFRILTELVEKQMIAPPDDMKDPYLNHLISNNCKQACIEELLTNTRHLYERFSLPLLAFAPHYRALIFQELVRLRSVWAANKQLEAYEYLNALPMQFMRGQFTGDVVADMSNFFDLNENSYRQANTFLNDELWPMERSVIFNSKFKSGKTLLEFLKRPLLSGYNIALSSGPRVRVRTGNLE